MIKTRALIFSFLLIICSISFGQAQLSLNQTDKDESMLYAQTKQLNQFFRRFNNEEDLNGDRYSKKDSRYRELSFRKKYLENLFDLKNIAISPEIKQEFISKINNSKNPFFIDFHAGNWFAEVETKFIYKGKTEKVILFLKLKEENNGWKWVFSDVFFRPFYQLFKPKSNDKLFLHPLSHELYFGNFNKIFKNLYRIEEYSENKPDFVTLFWYEMKNKNLKFIQVDNVKFHFFQVKNWYFEVSEFRRDGYNSGWLISNLIKVNEEKKSQLLKIIHHE